MFRAFTHKRNILILLISLLGIGVNLFGQKQGSSSAVRSYDQAAAALEKDPALTLEIINSLLSEKETKQLPKEKADLLFLKAKAQLKLGEREKSLPIVQEASDLFESIDEHVLSADSKLFIGENLKELGRANEAIVYYEKSRKEAELINDTLRVVEAILKKSNYYYTIANAESSLKYAIEAEKLLNTQEGMFSQKAIAFSTFGVIYEHLKEFDKAIEYLQKSIEAIKQSDDQSLLYKGYLNIAAAYNDNREIEKAEFYFKESLKVATEGGDLDRIAIIQSYLADFYLFEKRYHEAIPLFEKSLKRLEEMQNVYEAAYTIGTLGIAEMGVGNKSKGLRYMMRADTMIADVDMEIYKESLYKSMAEGCYEFGFYKVGFDFYQKYVKSKDKLRTEASDSKMLELKTQYETEKKEQEIDFLTNEKNAHDKIMYFSILTAFLLLFAVGVLFYSRNLMVKRNQALEKAKLFAEKAANEKAEFLATMSHEIRTPMNGVIGMANILAEENLSPEQSENLEVLRFSADNLLSLINDVLDLAKIEAGKITLENNSFNIKKYCIKNHYAFKTVNVKPNIDIKLDLDLDDLSCLLKGDVMRLNQVLMNLMNNALKFTEKGSITLKVSKVKEDSLSAKIKFEIVDTGIGISKEKQKSIFEKYEQASSDTSKKYGGTGLGLNICKEIVKLHNSELKLISEPGVGSNFFFEIEFKKSEEQIGEQNKATESSKVNIEGIRILLAEDNKVNQIVAKRILSNWGVKLMIAQNGLEAVKLVKSRNFDLILMDIQMPVMDGFEATSKIRALAGSKGNTPILAMTAAQISDVIGEIEANQMDGYISKPFNPKTLADAISKHTIRPKSIQNIALN